MFGNYLAHSTGAMSSSQNRGSNKKQSSSIMSTPTSSQPSKKRPRKNEEEHAGDIDWKDLLIRMDDKMDNISNGFESYKETLHEHGERLTDAEARIEDQDTSIENLTKRLNSTQAANLMIRREQYSLQKQVLRMSSCLDKLKEENCREMKEQERESRILVVSDFPNSKMKKFRSEDQKPNYKAFAFAMFKAMHPTLRKSDLLFVKSTPTESGRFRLVTELQTRQLAGLLRNKARAEGYTTRFGESKTFREMTQKIFKKCNRLNEENTDETIEYVVKNGHRLYKVKDDGTEEEVVQESSRDLMDVRGINLASPLYDFIPNSDSEADEDPDELEEQRRMSVNPEYQPKDRSEQITERRKRRREVVARVQEEIKRSSPPQKKFRSQMKKPTRKEAPQEMEQDTIPLGSTDDEEDPDAITVIQESPPSREPKKKVRFDGESHPTRGHAKKTPKSRHKYPGYELGDEDENDYGEELNDDDDENLPAKEVGKKPFQTVKSGKSGLPQPKPRRGRGARGRGRGYPRRGGHTRNNEDYDYDEQPTTARGGSFNSRSRPRGAGTRAGRRGRGRGRGVGLFGLDPLTCSAAELEYILKFRKSQDEFKAGLENLRKRPSTLVEAEVHKEDSAPRNN